MRKVVVALAVCGVLWANAEAFAEPLRPVVDPVLYRHGRVETMLGAMMMAMGVVTVAAAAGADHSSQNLVTVGSAEFVVGGWFVWRGGKDLRAARPATTLGVHVGARNAVLIHRRW